MPDDSGDRTVPSVVARTDTGDWLVGAVAWRQAVTNPTDTIYSVKRLIGRRFESSEVRELAGALPFRVVAGDGGDAWIRIAGHAFRPAQLSAHVLRHIKQLAEQRLGEPVDEAVVTVPAHFDDAQRRATRDAGEAAGLTVPAIVNEPSAAAIAYGTLRELDGATVAVFDLGGGAFDISILRIERGVFEVLATAGDTSLGGDDFDLALMRELMRRVRDEHGVDLSESATALQRLKEAAEKAKRDLSAMNTTDVQLPYLADTPGGPLHLQRAVQRGELEQLTAPLLARVEGPCRDALSEAGLGADRIDHVLLVGGMTRMPAVQRRVEQLFGSKPARDVNPDEIVALGAATYAAALAGELADVVLLDETPRALAADRDETASVDSAKHRSAAPEPEPEPEPDDAPSGRERLRSERLAALAADARRKRTRSSVGYGFVPESARYASAAFRGARPRTGSARFRAAATRPPRPERDPIQEDYETARDADLFARLGLHWTDAPSRLEPALESLRARYGPGSAAAERSPELAAKRLALAERAYEKLSTPSGRRDYRTQLDVDVKSAAELLDQQARIDLRREDYSDAADKLAAALDLDPTPTRKKALEAVYRELRPKPRTS